jgi:hypothetical protein
MQRLSAFDSVLTSPSIPRTFSPVEGDGFEPAPHRRINDKGNNESSLPRVLHPQGELSEYHMDDDETADARDEQHPRDRFALGIAQQKS